MHLRKNESMLSTMEINNLRERHSHSAHCQVFEPVDMLHIIGHDPLKPGEHDQYIVTGMTQQKFKCFQPYQDMQILALVNQILGSPISVHTAMCR